MIGIYLLSENLYQKLPLSEQVSSAPQLLHRRWQD